MAPRNTIYAQAVKLWTEKYIEDRAVCMTARQFAENMGVSYSHNFRKRLRQMQELGLLRIEQDAAHWGTPQWVVVFNLGDDQEAENCLPF